MTNSCIQLKFFIIKNQSNRITQIIRIFTGGQGETANNLCWLIIEKRLKTCLTEKIFISLMRNGMLKFEGKTFRIKGRKLMAKIISTVRKPRVDAL